MLYIVWPKSIVFLSGQFIGSEMPAKILGWFEEEAWKWRSKGNVIHDYIQSE